MALNTQLMSSAYFKMPTRAPSMLLGIPNCMPFIAFVSRLATKPRAMGTMIQRIKNATMLVNILVSVPSTLRYLPKVA